tara:strand:+ start:20 stop:295 length:276 start_codon:yes stop_codon:yes gene_type:complete
MFNTVKQKILKTKVVNEPYSHIIVKNFFPQKIYNDLIKTLTDLNSPNVPWVYHGVNKFNGNKDRKYFDIVYDFKIINPGSKLKNRKKFLNE